MTCYIRAFKKYLVCQINETLVELLRVHFPGCTFLRQPEELPIVTPPTQTGVEIVNSHTVGWAINSFLPYKAPGEDDIFPIMLHNSYPQIRHILISIYIEQVLR